MRLIACFLRERPARVRRLALVSALAAGWVLPLLAGCAGPVAFRGFRTTDGLGIAAELHCPDGTRAAPLLVLGHQLGRDRRSWDPLVPRLVRAGYAVVAVDHRGFGESTAEVASPSDLTSFQKDALYLDLLEAIDAVGDHPGVDTSRVAILASGLSVGPAVRTATERPAVRSLVLFSGLIEPDEEAFLLENPDFAFLLMVAAGDRRGRHLASQYASRLTGPDQPYMVFEADDRPVRDDWIGTDGLREDPAVADFVIWFLKRTIGA